MFEVGDKVVGNSYGYSHRVGEAGVVEIVEGAGVWVNWSGVDVKKATPGGIDLVSRATIIEPTPPSKMHPDDFVNAVNDFAEDNGFSVNTMAFETQGGATVYYTNPSPAN